MDTSAHLKCHSDGSIMATFIEHTTGNSQVGNYKDYEDMKKARKEWEALGCPNQVKAYTMQEYKERLARCPSTDEGPE